MSSYWNDPKIIGFLAAWIPFALSILLAFIPDQSLSRGKRMGWRCTVMLAGLIYSVVLWHQQIINDAQAKSDQAAIVTSAVQKSNDHSDKKIGDLQDDVDSVKTAISQSISSLSQLIGKGKSPPIEKVSYDASFWPVNTTSWPIHEESLPAVNGVVTFTFTIRVTGGIAKQAKLWLRLCKGCKYAKEPLGFQNLIPQGDTAGDPTERMLNIGDFLPNIAFTPVTVDVTPPPGQQFFLAGVILGCEGCDPIDPDKAKILHVNIQP